MGRYGRGFAWGSGLTVGAAALALLAGTTGLGLPSAEVGALRLARFVASALVGASLGVTGTVFQTLLRNALADPYILGISGGAALGGTLALAAGLPALVLPLGSLALELDATFLGAFIGGLGSILFLFGLALRGRGVLLHPWALLLVGFALNAFCSALVLVVRALVETRKTQEILYWLVGTLSDTRLTWPNLAVFALAFALGGGLLLSRAKTLSVLALGDDAAHSLGLRPARARLVLFTAASVLVALSVSLAGLVGFVGILVPQAVRIRFGADLRLLLPLSALYGAAFLALADTLTRLLFLAFSTELPVGLVSALVGAPAFVWILRREVRDA